MAQREFALSGSENAARIIKDAGTNQRNNNLRGLIVGD